MMDDVFNSPDESSIISSVSTSKYSKSINQMSTVGRHPRRPAAQRTSNIRRLADNATTNNSNISSTSSVISSRSYNAVAKSEPDLLDSKYMEYKRPWYNNPEYKGPRNQYYSTTSPSGSMLSMKYPSTTLPREIYPANDPNDIYETSSRYSSTSRKPHRSKRLTNQNSITASEPYDNNSAFQSFENLMDDRARHPSGSRIASRVPYPQGRTAGGPMRSVGGGLSSSPESAFSSNESAGGGVNPGFNSALSYDRNKTIKSRSRQPYATTTMPRLNMGTSDIMGPSGGYSHSTSPSRREHPNHEDVDEDFINPTKMYKNSASPYPNSSKNHLLVNQVPGRASSISRSDYQVSEIDELPRRSVGSDGPNSNLGGMPSYHNQNSPSYFQTHQSSSPRAAAPNNSYIDEKFIRRFSKRHSIVSIDSSTALSTNDDFSDSGSHRQPLPGTPQAHGEALFYVFSYLDTRSLARCGAVCRVWNMISRTPILWRHIRIKEATISPRTMVHMSNWCTQVREISFQRIKSSVFIENSESENSEFKINKIESSLKTIFDKNKTTLKTLKIVDCNEVITGHVLWTASQFCPSLTKLVYLSRTHPLSQADLFPLGRGCPKIHTLIVPPGYPCAEPDTFNDLCCDTVAKCWTNLKVLCIGGKKITHAGLVLIAKGCLKLQHFEIDHGPEITEDASSKMVACGLRGLVKLDFTFTPVSPRAIMMFAQACPKLVHIGIHCNIKNYFINHTTSKAKADYNSMKTLFKRLKSRPPFSKILRMNFDYDPDAEESEETIE